jgi:hypothetical protein
MCEFQHLYFGDHGYVVRCKECGHYQVAFLSTVLTLDESQFHELLNAAKRKCNECRETVPPHSKNIVLPTPASAVCLMPTRAETLLFAEILETADNEESALSLLSLFEKV